MDKKQKIVSENDVLKYEIAEELGLLGKVNSTGWKSLTARESGRIGGIMTKRRREKGKGPESEENGSKGNTE